MGLYPQPIERDRSFPLPIGITPIMTFSNLILAYYPKLSIQEIDPSPPHNYTQIFLLFCIIEFLDS
jgi:hypothetical protein